MKRLRTLIADTRGDAAVEAAFLFPIIIMICAALVLLSVYLPLRAAMQRSTQFAATAIATERSDTWLRFDPDTLSYHWLESRREYDEPGRLVSETSRSGETVRYRYDDAHSELPATTTPVRRSSTWKKRTS